MKKIVSGLLLLLTANFCAAQTDSIPEPEFMNVVYAWTKDKQLLPLEKVQAEMKTKNKTGIGGVKQVYAIPGGKSSVILAASDILFVVSGSETAVHDPSSLYQLLKFENKKNNRETVAAAYGGLGSKKNDGSNEISMNVKKIREGVFGLVPGQTLEKGEYAIINKMSMQGAGMTMKVDAYAFSVE